MKDAYTKNNFVSYLLVLLSLFVILFFTKGIFEHMQITLDERNEVKSELVEQEKELINLNALEATLKQEGSKALSDIQGFSGKVSDKNILQYLHSYADGVNTENKTLVFRDISISQATQSDLGFDATEISISAIFAGENSLFAFMNHLINPNAPYRFYITHFDYPMNESSGNLQVTIPLTLYHK